MVIVVKRKTPQWDALVKEVVSVHLSQFDSEYDVVNYFLDKAVRDEDGSTVKGSDGKLYFVDSIFFSDCLTEIRLKRGFWAHPNRELDTFSQNTTYTPKTEENSKNADVFTSLEKLVLDWADKRDLLSPANYKSQTLKVMEEIGELSGAMLKDRRIEELDAFGDVLVTLIILAKQRDVNLVGALKDAYDVIKSRTGKMKNGAFIKDEKQIKW